MNTDATNLDYANTQVREARRRLESVEERISEIEREPVVAVLNEETKTIHPLEDKDRVPEENRKHVEVDSQEKEIRKIEPHIQNIIIDCQMCIELSVKSMFKAVDQEFDYSHGINYGSHNTIEFNEKIPSDFSRSEDIIRAIFLTQLWEKFYEKAKYGAPEMNAGPEEIFNISDAEKAINDATFCVDLAEHFIHFIEKSDA